MEKPREWTTRGYCDHPGTSKQSVLKDQPSILPFLRASETVRRKPADVVKEEQESGDPEPPDERSVPGQVDERILGSSKIDTGQSVFDRQLGRLRSKTVSRDSFSNFPDLVCSREDLPHPSKLRSGKKGCQRKERTSDDSKVSSHLSQMKKRLNSWEDTPGVLQLMKDRRKKAKLDNVQDQVTKNTIPTPGISGIPPQFYQPVLRRGNPEQETLPQPADGGQQFVSRLSWQDPIGKVLSLADLGSMSALMLPHPNKLRDRTKAEKPHRLKAKQEDRVHDHIAQLKRKLILGENLPAAEFMKEMLPVMSQNPPSPTEGAPAPDLPTLFSPYRPEPSTSQSRLPPSNLWLCPQIDQGNPGTFDLYKENMQPERWYPSAGPSVSLAAPVKESPQQEPTSVKWPILDLSQIDSGRFALNGSAHLDQARLWHCDSGGDSSSKYPTITGCDRLDEE
ncbi:uncharacterized protein LOC135483823 isoform X2 [Lineus longissimus]|uniref:uncharacterized protein LOC135483823 isoform X2 n=1 Tax=Lineus longissimus TaxID=88925 RepID=UPI00315D2913